MHFDKVVEWVVAIEIGTTNVLIKKCGIFSVGKGTQTWSHNKVHVGDLDRHRFTEQSYRVNLELNMRNESGFESNGRARLFEILVDSAWLDD